MAIPLLARCIRDYNSGGDSLNESAHEHRAERSEPGSLGFARLSRAFPPEERRAVVNDPGDHVHLYFAGVGGLAPGRAESHYAGCRDGGHNEVDFPTGIGLIEVVLVGSEIVVNRSGGY